MKNICVDGKQYKLEKTNSCYEITNQNGETYVLYKNNKKYIFINKPYYNVATGNLKNCLLASKLRCTCASNGSCPLLNKEFRILLKEFKEVHSYIDYIDVNLILGGFLYSENKYCVSKTKKDALSKIYDYGTRMPVTNEEIKKGIKVKFKISSSFRK